MKSKFNVLWKENLIILSGNQNVKPTNSLIWLHGLGSGPEEFEYFFQEMDVVP